LKGIKVKILELSRKKAVRLFKQMGFKTAGNWTNAQLQRKLKNIPDLMEFIRLDTFKMKKTFSKITRADSVVIIDSEKINTNKEKETSKMATKKKKTSKKKSKKKVEVKSDAVDRKAEKLAEEKKAKTTKKESSKKSKKKSKNKVLDKLSLANAPIKKSGKKSKKKDVKKTGKKKKDAKKVEKKTTEKKTQKKGIKSQVFAVIGKKPKTHEQILEAAGLEKPQYGYLRMFVEEGSVEKTEKGYALTK
jgi:hypothetical protein